MTVGYFAPLPPARTGVADYAATLLAELRKFGGVEVAPPRSDIALYQLGNNSLHASIYRRAIEQPGVVLLHDALLQHFFLGQSDETSYVEEFVYNYGEWNRPLGHDLWRGRAGSGSDRRYFEYPMLRRIGERSRAVIVHNPAAAAVVRQHAPGARIVEIPHLFAPPPVVVGGVESIRLRNGWGVDPGAFLFAVFGYLRETKRLVTVLQAFERVHRAHPRTALLIAGDFVSTDLERAVRPMFAGEAIFRRPHLTEEEFWLAAGAVDACINLRYPAAGETSGIAIRLMGAAKPVLLTDSIEVSRFPEDACIRVAAGAAEDDSLRCHMELLAAMPDVAQAIGERAAEYVREHHAVQRVARVFWDILTAAAAAHSNV